MRAARARRGRERAARATLRRNGWTWEGGCFQKAMHVMLDTHQHFGDAGVRDKRLCHGEVRDSFHHCRWIPHAWVEMPATATLDNGEKQAIVVCVDLAQPDPNARYLPSDLFYRATEARNVKRYTFQEMCENALRFRHDGPWKEELQ